MMNTSVLLKRIVLQNTRSLSTSQSCLLIQKWRKEKGLSMNPNACGILTDKADYTYLDGRPTPLGMRQMQRIGKQKEIVMKIMQLTKEVDFAEERHKQMLLEQQRQKQEIITSKLKSKGNKLLD